MATSTAKLIRNRIIELIEDLIPTLMADQRFRAFRSEGDGAFRTAIVAAPQWRRFHVREVEDHETPEVSNMDVHELTVAFEVLIAYPHTQRAGDGALDRDDVIDADQHQIETTIGMLGRANFSGTHDACWLSRDSVPREELAGVDLLVIRQTMIYQRSMT